MILFNPFLENRSNVVSGIFPKNSSGSAGLAVLVVNFSTFGQAGLQPTPVTVGAASLAPWRRAFAALENFRDPEADAVTRGIRTIIETRIETRNLTFELLHMKF